MNITNHNIQQHITELERSLSIESDNYIRQSSITSNISTNNSSNITNPVDTTNGKIIQLENKQEGEVSFSIYWYYFTACGGYQSLFIFLFLSVLVTISW